MPPEADPITTTEDQPGGFQQIHVAGFCSLKEVDLQPGRMTVLIGPNGAGKSNLLQALRLIPLLRTRSLQRYVADHGFGAALLHYGPKKTEVIALGVVVRDQETTFRYDACLAFAPDDTLYFQAENVTKIHPDGTRSILSLGGGHRESHLLDESYSDPTVAAVNHWLGRMTFYHFHDTSPQSRLRTHARREDDRYPRSDGSNLAAYLLRLKESENPSDQKAWQRINRHCQIGRAHV